MKKLKRKRDVHALTKELIDTLKHRTDISLSKHSLIHTIGTYDFLRIASKPIKKNDPVVLIRANLHGDEIAGFYTMLYHIGEILSYAHSRGIKLIIYPLANPSGFEYNVRYNADGDKGDWVNNHFLHYELPDGTFLKDIEGSNVYKKWYWASDPKLKIRLAAETALMHKLLKKEPLSQVVAHIDLHQDYFTQEVGPAAYHYANEQPELYAHIIEEIRRVIPILSNYDIGAGFNTTMISDANGLILRHDGSLPDLLYRAYGIIHGITPETTGATPLALACHVNLIWIKGVLDLVANKTPGVPNHN